MAGFKYQIEKSASRAQFEADKRLRISKVRTVADRVRKNIKSEMTALSQKALDLAIAGEVLNPPLQEITDAIIKLRAELEGHLQQIEGIKAEAWVPPPPPPPPPPKPPKPVVEKPEPKPAEAMPAPASTTVSQRLMEYINEDVNKVECPRCHALSRPEENVCRNCGYRFRDAEG
jgi:hypothetical protein